MRDKEMVGIGRVVIARRERVVMLESFGKGILGTTLRYPYEVREAESYFEDVPDIKLPDEMKQLASHILETKRADFDPEKFEDRYETALVALLKSKQAGLPVKAEAPNVVKLMDALRRSIDAEKPAAASSVESAASRRRPSQSAGPHPARAAAVEPRI